MHIKEMQAVLMMLLVCVVRASGNNAEVASHRCVSNGRLGGSLSLVVALCHQLQCICFSSVHYWLLSRYLVATLRRLQLVRDYASVLRSLTMNASLVDMLLVRADALCWQKI
jgi:hypothetical protein